MTKRALREALERPDPTDVPVATGLANLGLSMLAVVASCGLFVLVGILLGFWHVGIAVAGLGALCALLFAWRRRLPYLASALAALGGGGLLLAGGGPAIGTLSLGAILAAAAVLFLFWPLFEVFA